MLLKSARDTMFYVYAVKVFSRRSLKFANPLSDRSLLSTSVFLVVDTPSRSFISCDQNRVISACLSTFSLGIWNVAIRYFTRSTTFAYCWFVNPDRFVPSISIPIAQSFIFFVYPRLDTHACRVISDGSASLNAFPVLSMST